MTSKREYLAPHCEGLPSGLLRCQVWLTHLKIRMKLYYSFNTNEPLWFPGDLPFPARPLERVKVRLQGSVSSHFPPFLETGDLLTRHRPSPSESAVTLLLTYQYGTVPPRTSPEPEKDWHPVPGSPIFGQIRIALSPEAVGHIRKVV